MANPRPDQAVLAMKEGSWREAAELWRACLADEGVLSVVDYHALARVHECRADWDAYACVIARGLESFPEDRVLAFRRQHSEAIDCIAQGLWEQAWEILETLRLKPVESEWPCALHYWRRHVRYQQAVSDADGKRERLARIAELALHKSTELWPWYAAGMMQVVDCMEWSIDLRHGFFRLLEPVVQGLRSYDVTVRKIKDGDLDCAIAKLAAFWYGHYESLLTLPAGYCEFFARLFLSRGHIDLYLRLRDCFSRQVSRFDPAVQSLGVARFIYRVALANEQSDRPEYDRLRAYGAEQEYAKDVEQYLALSAAYYADAPYTPAAREQDAEFQEYIHGKSIAIVGPVDVGLASGEEIDSFDRVVRFNHRSDVHYDEIKFGRRTDISYYVRQILAREPTPGIIEGMAALDYAVIYKESWHGCTWLDIVTCRKRVRPDDLEYLTNPLLVGYPLAVTRAILDLLSFNPRRIKVFSADLYTSMGYGQGYLKGSSMGSNGGNMFPGLGVHDPISNLLLMRSLCQRTEVETDDVLQRVLGLTVPQYIDCLKTVHSRFLLEVKSGERCG